MKLTEKRQINQKKLHILIKTKTDSSASKQSQLESQGNKSKSRHRFSFFLNEKSNLKRGKDKPLAKGFIKNQQQYDIKWRIVKRRPAKIKRKYKNINYSKWF